MNDPDNRGSNPEPGPSPDHEPPAVAEEDARGLSLTVAYSLIALAIIAAIGLALFIVLPFYHRR